MDSIFRAFTPYVVVSFFICFMVACPGIALEAASPVTVDPISTDPVGVEGDDLRRLTYSDVDRGRARFFPSLERWSFVGPDHAIRQGRGGDALDPMTLEPVKVRQVPAEKKGWEGPDPALGFDAAFKSSLGDRQPSKGRPDLLLNDDQGIRVTAHENLIAARQGDGPVKITEMPGKLELAKLAPGGRFYSGVLGSNLYVVDLFGESLQQVTQDGSEDLLNGKLDWVYQEEVYGRGNFNAQWWSPDGRFLAFLKLMEEGVPEFQIIRHLPFAQKVITQHYPKAGQTNPRVELWVYDTQTDRARQMEISVYDEERLIVRVDWSPDSAQLLPQVQDRIQSGLTLLTCDPLTGGSKVLIEETSTSWVNVLGSPRWLSDGTFLWKSERTGFAHLFHYRPDGELIRQVSRGEWEVGSIARLDEDRQELWLTGSLGRAIESHLYRLDLGGNLLVQITHEPGSHRTTISPDGEYVLDRFSSVENPGEYRLLDRDGRKLKVLAEGRIPALDTFEDVEASLHEVPARDGYSMDVMVMKPVGLDPNTPLPVFISTYSGPNAPTVRQGYPGSGWLRFLVHQGMVVLQVNVRSSSSRGQVDTAACYRQLGVQELLDIEDALSWLCENSWADQNRVGISGWSYGGFMAAYALTHSKAFKLGIAGGGVYDWRDYDTIYTERYMDTPQLNPDGYAKSSVIEAAADLNGHLLILHGGIDDNVHVQNAMQLAHRLQENRKSFEMMIYPESGHGVRGRPARHMRDLEWKAIQEHLLAPLKEMP
ncbi:MAG: hypothetical protein CBC13_10735 [Planctomycetia bacterium TMED53]|nr:MAG: hypothetical protein CBC13_10735 [Planctomycetia bacterium TMED53]